MGIRILPALLLITILFTAPAQSRDVNQSNHPPGQDASGNNGSDYISLAVVATDKDQNPVMGLRPEEFQAYEENREFEVTRTVPSMSRRVRVGLLLDISRNQIRKHAKRYALCVSKVFEGLMREGDMGFVASLPYRHGQLGHPTGELSVLHGEVAEAYSIPSRAFFSSVFKAIRQISEEHFWGTNESKALVILAGGSTSGTEWDPVQGEKEIRAAQAKNIAVYVLFHPAMGARLYDPQFGFLDRAKKISDRTGGVTYAPNSERDLASDVQSLISHFKSTYFLTLDVSGLPHDGKFHRIEVKSTRPNVKVSGQKGFYAREDH